MMKEFLKDIIIQDISALDTAIDKYKKVLVEEYIKAFQSEYPEHIYLHERQKEYLIALIDFIEQNVESDILRQLQNLMDLLSDIVLEGNFLPNSTSALCNLANLYDKRVQCLIIKKFKVYLEFCNQYNNGNNGQKNL